jgi:hypothetical protein
MPESEQHIMLVRKMYAWVCDSLFNGDCGYVYVDLPEISKFAKPPSLSSGVRPDLYAKRFDYDLFVIGEAKTAEDIETRHSILQYRYYIDECEKHPGASTIVVAVPWFMHRTARNLLLHLLTKSNATKTRLEVLDKLPG